MFPPFFDTVKGSTAVKSAFGNSPRIFPHGMADQNTVAPYCTFQIITGAPENFLHDRPDIDAFTLQLDVYAKTAQAASDGAKAIRDAVEGVAYITAWRGQFKDPDTSLFRYSFDVDWLTPRT